MKDNTSSTVHTETRRLAAIMFTDMVGFSRQMGSDEARMLRLLDTHNRIIQDAVTEHHGHVIKVMGDAFLVDFPSVVHAVQCAQAIQAQFRTHNAKHEAAEQIHVRIGIHLGDVVQRDGDVFGDGVNVASRLQALAEPDTICISHKVYEEVAKKLPLGTVVSLGRPRLKNIAERFQTYALLPEPPQGLRQTLQIQRLKFSRQMGTAHRAVAGGLLVAGVILTVWYLALPALITHHYQWQQFNALGQAYLYARRYEEAMVALKRVLTYNPNFWSAHWGLAVIYSELGREEEAKAAGAEMLQITPQSTVEGWRRVSAPFKDPADTERIAAALRKAGLP
jgi:class 3 adenylate cyclase